MNKKPAKSVTNPPLCNEKTMPTPKPDPSRRGMIMARRKGKK